MLVIYKIVESTVYGEKCIDQYVCTTIVIWILINTS